MDQRVTRAHPFRLPPGRSRADTVAGSQSEDSVHESHARPAQAGPAQPSSFWFESYRLDVRARRLSRHEETLPVSSKAFDVLTVLVQRAGETVTKSELMDLVWPGVFVDEVNLAQHVSALRKLLGDTTKASSFIATIPRIGYQFVAPVSTTAPMTASETRERRAGDGWRFAAAAIALGALTGSIVLWLGNTTLPPSPSVGSDNPTAVEAYSRGRHLIRQGSHEGLAAALAEFETAVTLDPGFARAQSELANTVVSMFLGRRIGYREALNLAQTAASAALAAAPDLSEAHAAQGAIYMQLGGGFEKAEAELRRALVLDPSNALAWDLLARGLRHQGRFAESIDAARQAKRLEPDSVRYYALLARSLFFAGQDLDEARLLCRQALPLDPSSTNVLELLADIEEYDGRLAEAVAVWAEFERARGAGDLADELIADGGAYGPAEALQRYREALLERLSGTDPEDGFERGRVLERLGRRDEALEALRRASVHEYTIGLFGLRSHPAYHELSADPRFAELERLVGAFLVADAGVR